MRLLHLSLEKYGPFTGLGLDFDPAAKLHVVYGRNEAGKSSALDAITDLLFSFEHRVRHGFLHDAGELRVGARLAATSDMELFFRRRRGKSNTLLDERDTALPDDTLLPFLGGLTRQVFTRAFGLSTQTLRKGAEEMLKSEGDLGATLFAAASGLKDLNDLRRSIEQEADTIFAPRASQSRRFYQALQHHENARRAIRDNELKASDWKALNQRIGELGARLEEITAARRQATAERARLARLKRVAPCLRLIDEALDARASLGALPDVPADFTAELEARLDTVGAARQEMRRASDELVRAADALKGVTVAADVLASAQEIGSLVANSGACDKDRVDLPRVRAEAEEIGRTLDTLATRLGFAGSEELVAGRPTDAAQKRMEPLLVEGRDLRQAQTTRAETLRTATEELQRLERQCTEQGHVSDPRPLQERLAALTGDLRRLDRLGELRTEAEAKARSLREDAARLSPPADLEVVAAVSLPAAETIERFRVTFEDADTEWRRARERRDDARTRLAKLDEEIASLLSGGPVPSTAVIAEVRTRRDGVWRSLRGTLLAEGDGAPPEEVPEKIAEFERAASEADSLADRAALDAERLASHAAALRDRERQSSIADAAGAQVTELSKARQAEQKEWADIWLGATDRPLSPAGMAEWSRQLASLLERRSALATVKDNIAALESIERRILPVLLTLAPEVGVSGLEAAGAIILAGALEERLRVLARNWDEARDAETRRRDAETRIARLEALMVEDAARHAAWSARWQAAVLALGLSADASLEEAEAALQAWREVPSTLRERENRRGRIRGMERDVAAFEARLREVAGRLCSEFASASAEAQLQALQDRLEAAKAAQVRKTHAAEREAEAQETIQRASAELKSAETALHEMATVFPDGADLNAELHRLTKRDRLDEQLVERRQQLAVQGEGLAEATLREELRTFDPDAAEARIAELETEEARLEDERLAVHTDRERGIERREALEMGTGAESAAQDKATAEAELAAAARDWMVLKLGALMIQAAVERHRAAQEDPLMRRAGELFATVTGGAFERLGQDYDEQDQPRLVGRRAGGAAVTIDGMSEGTRDQLYLALRLAYIEDYASRAEPVPFIGDDLFSTFDDERTANGLKVLAEVGDRVQTILFTHHAHVSELARDVLKDQVDLLNLP